MVTADTEPVTVDSRRSWFDEHTPDRRPLWVAEEHGVIVGWLSFSDFYGRPAYAATAEVSVYVGEQHRGKGLGTYFLRHAVESGSALGMRTLLGFIFAHNRPSLRLFAGIGFAEWGSLPKVAVLDGTERDLLILGKRLPVS